MSDDDDDDDDDDDNNNEDDDDNDCWLTSNFAVFSFSNLSSLPESNVCRYRCNNISLRVQQRQRPIINSKYT